MTYSLVAVIFQGEEGMIHEFSLKHEGFVIYLDHERAFSDDSHRPSRAVSFWWMMTLPLVGTGKWFCL